MFLNKHLLNTCLLNASEIVHNVITTIKYGKTICVPYRSFNCEAQDRCFCLIPDARHTQIEAEARSTVTDVYARSFSVQVDPGDCYVRPL